MAQTPRNASLRPMLGNRAVRLWGGAILAGLAVALLPGTLTGPGTDLTRYLGAFGWIAIPVLFLAGVLTSLTPCVYPLIPITVAIFGAGKKARSRGRAAALSSTYVGGIAVMYTGLGLVAAATGHKFGRQMGNPIVVGAFAVLMLVFAASMFGAFDLALPAGLQAKLSGVAGVGFTSAFLMGLVAGIVAAPCTGPVLMAVLTFVAKSGNLWLGFWFLLTYALGMGLLFFVLGTFSMSLPKSGPWMDVVKSLMGIALVLVAISFLQPFLPKPHPSAFSEAILATAAGVLVALAVLAGAVHLSFHGSATQVTVKSFGVAVIVAAFALRVGWIYEPGASMAVAVHAGPGSAAAAPVPKIHWFTSAPQALARARAERKPVLADFFATWCTACMELDRKTFSDPRVRALVNQRFVPLKVDSSQDTDEVDALQKKYGVVGLPVVTFIDGDGRQRAQPRIDGYLPPGQFAKLIATVH